MKCPNCNETLVMAERQGIEIDYCPACRGVWLDKGELDKIIERSAELNTSDNPRSENVQQPYSQSRGHGSHHNNPYKHGRKGFLGNLFDF
ncbi:zf-TFIIB domain-containing protein [Daejeonella sp.]|uniref:TFIIB-type zinc ribbon-containing protein n=1 Tax=Daejeonella sp. TaxID=2805397 RepID=UPI0027167BFA|nr:zf-TFIIB domain-containing protein [Daejeonella sp.]MDO8992833.1 zf-TFIIB domain-containing protein [Daejeonella sp.]MDP2412455.1 zf-TFIIB domain-containing protein [Daejeonella sp.]